MPTPDKPIQIRRTDDLCPPGGQPFNPDHCTTALDMRTRIAALERETAAINKAFPLNDLGLPDYESNRKMNIKVKAANETMEKYKMGAVEKIIGVVVAFVLGLLATGFVTQLSGHLK